MNALETAKQAAKAALEKKALKIVLQDLGGASNLCDYQLICSGTNTKQTQAICMSIEEGLKKSFGIKPIAVEGRQSGTWILIDYGSTIIHIFENTLRDHYRLESLWPTARLVDLDLSLPQQASSAEES